MDAPVTSPSDCTAILTSDAVTSAGADDMPASTAFRTLSCAIATA